MNQNVFALRLTQLTAIAAASFALAACSKSSDPAVSYAASAPAAVALTAPVAAVPAASPLQQRSPDGYEQGRRDQERQDARHERHERQDSNGRPLSPRSDRDNDMGQQAQGNDARRGNQVAQASCVDCGVIESVDTVQVQGQANGVGAVAGGLGGALVGNRIAGKNNRALGGVIGAVGGGLLGNAIEKHERTETLYDVHVRMTDGTIRTVRQTTAPAPGVKVRVEADGLHDRS